MVSIYQTLSVKSILLEKQTTTFQSNGFVVSKDIWFELDLKLSNAYLEKRALDGQSSIGVGSNVPV